MRLKKIIVLILPILITSCVTLVDVRSKLEQQVLPGQGCQETQFAYIGTIDTPDGRLYVATQKIVLTKMFAPRGQSWLHLFNQNCSLIGSYSLSTLSEPLWCEGSKIYLAGFGYHGSIPPDQELIKLFRYPSAEKELGYPTGNVIDFSSGARKPVLRREWRYGSSGGINDDPFKLQKENE